MIAEKQHSTGCIQGVCGGMCVCLVNQPYFSGPINQPYFSGPPCIQEIESKWSSVYGYTNCWCFHIPPVDVVETENACKLPWIDVGLLLVFCYSCFTDESAADESAG